MLARALPFLAASAFFLGAHAQQQKSTPSREIMEGDIIFQTSLSSQSRAIQLATKSRYSHMGIIFRENGEFHVFEAARTVRMTPLDEWIKRGKDEKYVIKRLRNANDILTAQTLTKLKKESKKFAGKSYDLTFGWSDEKIYCSELVWKIYKRGANIEIGKLQQLGDFDLSSAIVKAKLKERYGDNIPLNETVISPASMFESELLVKSAVHLERFFSTLDRAQP
ncbi:MAG: YiiX family permuted papain-like enzyme [Zoogloeaceae bacterium]|jgi:uncharacterized protein YycO|nr:YiiX family permuted papain-like enzyme [Zoogloeaceae bacterium]